MESTTSFCHYLQELRTASGLSRNAWAKSSGITRMTLWRWEQGRTLPRAEELSLALAALPLSLEQKRQARDLWWQSCILRQAEVKEKVLPENCGTLLRNLRIRKGWTQSEMAEQLQVSRSRLARWEGNRTVPSEEDFHQLLQQLESIAGKMVGN